MSNLNEVRKITRGPFKGYNIDEYGNVLSKKKGKYLKQHKKGNGLLYVCTKKMRGDIHHLLAIAFIPVKKDLPYILFVDGNNKNIHYSNLIWSNTVNLSGENFKPIHGFSRFLINQNGTIKSICNKFPVIRKPYVNHNGYLAMTLIGDDNISCTKLVHRLVAVTHIPNPNNLPIVDHINRNKTDTNINNLRWVTHSENGFNVNREKFKHAKKIGRYTTDNKLMDIFNSVEEAVEKLNLKVGLTSLRNCAVKNIQKTYNYSCSCGFIWKYIDNNRKIKYVLKDEEIKLSVSGTFGDIKLDYPYYITNYGNLINKNGYRKNYTMSGGYPSYKLSKNSVAKAFLSHVLVALFFVDGKTKNKCIVNHIDENKINSKWDNLEWVTPSDNVKHSLHKKRKPVNQIDIKTGNVLKRFNSIKDAVINVNGNNSGISLCCNMKQKTAYGYKWEFCKNII